MSKYDRMIHAERAFVADRPAMSEGMNGDPERTAKALLGEAGELVEAVAAFQLSGSQEDFIEIGQELADINIYALGICAAYELDMYEETMTKIAFNTIRFAPYMFDEGKDYKSSYFEAKNNPFYKPTKQEFYDDQGMAQTL